MAGSASNVATPGLGRNGGVMGVRRLRGIPGFSIDRVAAAAGDDPDVLRLENLDTDVAPPPVEGGSWRFDPAALAAAADATTRAVMLPNPAMPTGALLDDGEWAAVSALCRERDLWLIYVGWMEAILFDGLPLRHPAALPG